MLSFRVFLIICNGTIWHPNVNFPACYTCANSIRNEGYLKGNHKVVLITSQLWGFVQPTKTPLIQYFPSTMDCVCMIGVALAMYNSIGSCRFALLAAVHISCTIAWLDVCTVLRIGGPLDSRKCQRSHLRLLLHAIRDFQCFSWWEIVLECFQHRCQTVANLLKPRIGLNTLQLVLYTGQETALAVKKMDFSTEDYVEVDFLLVKEKCFWLAFLILSAVSCHRRERPLFVCINAPEPIHLR